MGGTVGDRFEIDIAQLPGIVRGLGDRARDADGVIDDARDLASKVHGLGGSVGDAATRVDQAVRYIESARTGLFSLQKDVAARAKRIGVAEGYPELIKVIDEALKPPPEHHWYDHATDFAGDAWDFVSSNPMETLHTTLDVVGFIPVVGEVADGLNALIYLGEGNYANAALSAAALVPVVGSAATGARLTSKGLKVVKGVSEAERVGNGLLSAAAVADDANRVIDGTRSLRNGLTHLDAAAHGTHPGRLAAESSAVSQQSIMRSLRQTGTPEALATASLIKRGNVNLVLKPSHPQGLAGLQPFGTRDAIVYLDTANTPARAATYAAHESRHVLQHLTPSTYRRVHEVEAYQWQRAASSWYGATDSEITAFVNKHYGHVRP
jgi:hypothetical protein